MFEWDEAKRQTNVDKHGLDFRDAHFIFDGRPYLTYPTDHAFEARHLTITMLNEQFVTLIWIWRGSMRRAISMRRARHEERRAYRQVHG